jgi:carbon storage regulator CsrA
MLVVSRRRSEVIVLGDSNAPLSLVRITVLDCGLGTVKFGIDAPSSVAIDRLEVWEQIHPRPGAPPTC